MAQQQQAKTPAFQYISTCLRVKYPAKTCTFFVNNFGMKLLHKEELNDLGVTWYFLISPRTDQKYPDTSTKEATDLLSSYNGGVLQLKYDHGNEENDNFKINNGNVEPHRGFGHIAFNTDDVYAVCAELEKNGVTFKKKPNEGRMKGLAFAYDPNGYWIEIVKRDQKCGFKEKYNLSQTMLRVKDPEKTLKFYRDILGMKVINERHFEKGKFSLFFLSSFVEDVDNLDKMNSEQRYELMKKQYHPVVELTHNWDTEKDDKFNYHNGNDASALGVGFTQISFLVDDLKESVKKLKENNVKFKELPNDCANKQGENGYTFIEDPDRYTVEILQRGQSPVNSKYNHHKNVETKEKQENEEQKDNK